MKFRILVLVAIAATLSMGSQCGFGTPPVSDIATAVDQVPAQFTSPGDGSGKSQESPAFLRIANDYPNTQYVFVNTEFIGTVASRASQLWQMNPGSYSLTCSDSGDRNDNPVNQDFSVMAGEVYEFRVYNTNQ